MLLVTGGAGYVGSVLVPELLALGYRVRVVDTQWFGNTLPSHPRLESIEGDIGQFDSAWLDQVTAVIHLAGISNDPTAQFAPRLNLESNATATRTLAEAVALQSERAGREIRLLFASSCSIYYTVANGATVDILPKHEETPVSPTAPYSKAKRLAEMELLRIAAEFPHFCPVLLRKGTLFGLSPRMRFDLVINAFTLAAWRHQTLTVHGSGEAWRPLLHIGDAVDAYLYCLTAPAARVRGQIYNVVHKNYRVLELAHWVSEVLELKRGVRVEVKRDRSFREPERSYYVSGGKMASELGFRAERGTSDAVLEIWDRLKAGKFGAAPQDDARFFNLRRFQQLELGDPAHELVKA